MRNALLTVPTLRNGTPNGRKNIGDYIQSLAGEMFFDTIDEYIDRERLAEYKSESERARIIMNGWYMRFPEYWPPSDDILPLLISMHISLFSASRMLSTKGITYLQKYGPVGCRDKATESLLKQHNIPCYFSGCLTLTLGEKYKMEHKRNSILFVDPYFEAVRNKKEKISIINTLKSLFYGIINIGKIKRLQKVFWHSNISTSRVKIIKNILFFLNASAFYKTYSSYFDDQVLFNGVYVAHMVKVGKNTALVSEEQKLNYARNLMQKYAEASLVITSRIHCALPCLGVETPVIFVTSERLESIAIDSHRFDGLLDLFRVMQYENLSLTTNDDTITKKITADTVVANKRDYIPIKEALIKRCREFVLQTN
jgi:hypothetical protein